MTAAVEDGESMVLPRKVAVDLAQALVAHLAQDADLRILALKGPTLAHHGLRKARVSSDVDFLLMREDLPAMSALLEQRGWRERTELEVPGILERHSVALIHDEWPIDIDLHWYFPGLHATPSVSFDALWKHRQVLSAAGRPVVCLDLTASALVAAVHCVRYPHSVQRQAELRGIRDRVATDPTVAADLLALAEGTRSVSVLRTLFEQLGFEVGSGDLTSEEMERWHRYTSTHELGSTGAWLSALREGSPGQRVRTMGRAVWPSRAELQRAAPPGTNIGGRLTARQAWQLRVLRWRRARAAVLPTIRVLRGGGRGPKE